MQREPRLEHVFDVEIQVGQPILAGADARHGRRQIVMVSGGKVSGGLSGTLLPGGTDCQLIRPDGNVEIFAQYGVRLDDGETFFVRSSGMRRVNSEYAAEAAQGKVIDPEHIYFVTNSAFETYSEKYKWLEEKLYIAHSMKTAGCVRQRFYRVVIE